ncbi:hypothetical protein ACIBCN_19290 [Nocardia sp. NPDC051052]|uniref:hypothetical protein n=1 Tax=Nocardia sp. NPDC051052 TaxID=3364322 RepID=UPI00379A4BAB
MTREDTDDTTRAQLADRLRLRTPDGDDVAAAGDLANFVLDRMLEATDALNRYATLRLEEAPVSSRYAIHLAASIASEVTAWVRRWPA